MVLVKYSYIRNIFIVSIATFLISMFIWAMINFTMIFPLYGTSFWVENGTSESVALNKDEIYYIYSDNPIADFSFKGAVVETQFIEQSNPMYTFLKKNPTGKIIASEGQITFLSEKRIGGKFHSESELLRYHGIIDSFWYRTLELILTITFVSTFILSVLWFIYRKNKKFVIYRVKIVKR